MKRTQLVALALADAMLAGEPELAGLKDRCAWALGRKHRWIAPLCRRVFQRFGSALDHRDRAKLAQCIHDDESYGEAWRASRPPRIEHFYLDPPPMSPRTGALAACDLPNLATSSDLAAWLGISIGELDWFADVRVLNGADGPLCHYGYAWVPKRFGMRLMEIPKIRLREIQRKILRGILDPVPVHAAAHGFRRGHSCRTYVEPHVGREVVLRVDLRNFFPGIPSPRIHGLLSTLGYPDAVARILTALCTNSVPMSVARGGGLSWEEAKRLGIPHLPQGAPTSPALANLCALHLDLRLHALAEELGGKYTRYADDIAISGGKSLRRRIDAVSGLVATIASEEGFQVNHRKTRAMHRTRQQLLTGIVVNEKANVRRSEFDRLKATLTNCVRHGPQSQNREGQNNFRAHLAGRIAYVASLNAPRGQKLQELFGRIEWPSTEAA